MALMKSTASLHRLRPLILVVTLNLCSDVVEASEYAIPLNNKTIIKMVKDGLGSQAIIAMIETQPGKYKVSRKAILTLKKCGVADKVIAALVKSAKGADDPARLQPFFGPGLTWLSDDYVDFKEVREEDEYIFIENDSRLRPELMAGVVLKLWDFKPEGWKFRKTIDFVAGLEFTKGGQDPLDAVFFGLGYGLTPHIELVGGYSRSRGKELSPGFKRNMGQFIKENPKFQNIDIVDGMIAKIEHYDGLPLYKDTKNGPEKIYPGNPVTNSFNSRWSVGVMLKFDIFEVFEKVAHD